MRHFILVLTLCGGFTFFANAQKITYHPNNRPTKVEGEFDKTVRACVTEPYETLQGEAFSFADWLCTVLHYNSLMVNRMTSGFVDKIAAQRARALEVSRLAQTCDVLKPAKAELTKIGEIYEKKVKTGEEENSDGKAKMDLDTAKELIKLTTKALEKLKVTRRITDIR